VMGLEAMVLIGVVVVMVLLRKLVMVGVGV
jgi:hypothetical protein